MPPARWTIGLSMRISIQSFIHSYAMTGTVIDSRPNVLWSSCREMQSNLQHRHRTWQAQCPTSQRSKNTNSPVVPELNRIHSGQSKGSCAHSISPSLVRPSCLSLPICTKLSKLDHLFLLSPIGDASCWDDAVFAWADCWMMTTWGVIPARSDRPLSRALSFGKWGWTLALYLDHQRID